jgi:hypothetical protein
MKKLITICAIAGLILAAGGVAQAVPTTTGWMNPTANIPGPNNWGFNKPASAYTYGIGLPPDDWPTAEAMPGTMQGKPFNVHEYYGYGFSVPAGATIDGIEVRMDASQRSLSPPTTSSLAVELSWDGGTSWTTTGYGTGPLNSGGESPFITYTIYTKGGISDDWGHTWTADEINNNNDFRVRLTATIIGSSNGRTYLDWVPVAVTYTASPVPEPTTICLLGLGALSLLRRKR